MRTKLRTIVHTGGVTRRRFLRASGSLAMLSLLPVLGEGSSGRTGAWRPRLALSSVMFSQLTLEAFCRQAQELGFKGIDVWSPFGNCRHLAEAQEMGGDSWRRLLAKHQLKVACYTTYRTTGHEQGFPGFAEFIGASGGGLVVRESQYGTFPPDQIEASMRKFFETLQPEIELARKHRVCLAIENHADALLSTLASFQAFTKLNPAPDVVGVALAFYHLQVHKVPIEEVIRACGRQLLFVYAWQHEPGLAQLPGQGPADFGPWLRALAQQDYTHWISPFMHGEQPVEAVVAAVTKACRCLESAAEQQSSKPSTNQP
jgi:sugar phosphate isomerase/epimerase